VYLVNIKFCGEQIFFFTDVNCIGGSLNFDDIQPAAAAGDSETAALTDSIVFYAVVLAERPAGQVLDRARLAFGQKITVVAGIKILAFFFVANGQAMLPGQAAHFAFGQFAKRKKRAAKLLLAKK